MRKLTGAIIYFLAISTASAAEYTSNQKDFAEYIGKNWMFFFEDNGKQYFKVINCTDDFLIVNSILESQCAGGIGEPWAAFLSTGTITTLFLYEKHPSGLVPDNSYIYLIEKSQGNYFAGYMKSVSGNATPVPKRAFLRIANIDSDLTIPQNDPESRRAEKLHVGGSSPIVILDKLNIPRATAFVDGAWRSYRLQLQIAPAEGIQLKLLEAVER